MTTANLIAASALVGLIWTIQLVHYPLFALIDDTTWERYMRAHARRISVLAGPLMVANLAIALILFRDQRSGLVDANLALAFGAFASTGLIFGPLHGRLTIGDVDRLVRLNWLRTALWTAQIAVGVALLD